MGLTGFFMVLTGPSKQGKVSTRCSLRLVTFCGPVEGALVQSFVQGFSMLNEY